MVTLSIAYVGALVYDLALQAWGASGGVGDNVASEQRTNHLPLPSTSTSSTEEGLALLSPANVLVALNVISGFAASSLSYLVHLPKVAYIPVKHALAVLSYAAYLLLRPLHPIIVPVRLAVKIITTPLLVPVLLVHQFAVLLYPLYVFLGAAVICGTLTGILARRLSRAVVEDVLGVGGRHRIRRGERKESLPGRGGRSRGKAV